MKFTTPCYVCITDAKKRAELCGWLNEIGYSEAATIFSGGSHATCIWCDNTRSMIPCFIRTRRKFIPQDVFCCGSNIELFKALAAMNDWNDREQWFIEEGRMFKCTSDKINNYSYHWQTTRKATAEEIVEHFKKRKV